MGRGRLRVYLGAAPGVGKTYAALEEVRRMAGADVDVVVGLVESHGRAETEALLDGLEVIPRLRLVYRGVEMEEMDLDAVLARDPEFVLVDELAHTNVPGSRHLKRWEDVQTLMEAGIDVISTVNIQHLQSLNDVIAEITGVTQQEIVPDEVVRAADEIEMVDLTQEGIRDRLTAGKIYPAERVDAALANFFRPGNLAALRELALSWTADRVDEELDRYRRDHGIDEQWETRERVVVAITGAAGGDVPIRRAARMAMRSRGRVVGVHVRLDEGLTSEATRFLDAQRKLLEELGGEYHEMGGPDVAEAVVEFAASHNATQLVVGASRRSRWDRLLRGSVIEDILRRAGPIDVHVISDPDRPVPERFPRPTVPSLPRRRVYLGWVVASLGLALTSPILLVERGNIDLQNVLLVYLLVAVVAAWAGGFAPALGAGVVGFLLANYLFTPPYLTWTIDSGQDVFALVAFTVVAGAMGGLVSLTARRSNQIRIVRAEAETLAALAAGATTGSVERVIDRLGSVLTPRSVALFETTHEGLRMVTSSGREPPESLGDCDRTVSVDDDVLAIRGDPLRGAEERLLSAFASQLVAVRRRDRLMAEAADAHALSKADELRTAILRAVSHDLRSPLASIKATVSGLLEEDVSWTPDQTRELLEATYAETLRLDHVVADVLDAGRLQSDAVRPRVVPVGLEEVVAAALTGIGRAGGDRIEVNVSEELPQVQTDPALLERVIENLVRNAIQYTPEGMKVIIDAGSVGAGRVDLRVIDHGPGIPIAERERIFQPFQRLDEGSGGGVGLGLAVAGGLCEALGHALSVEDTQGGGTTMTITFSLGAVG